MTGPNSGRPLSPHLSIYRWPVTMTLSILHRVSGVALSLGLLALAAWLIAVSVGGDSYLSFAGFMGGPVGLLLLVGWSASFFFHLANGIRHLVWDLGYGFELPTANGSAWFVLVLTIVLTAAFWAFA